MNDVIGVQLAISKLHFQSLLEQPKNAETANQALAELNTALTELEAVNDELNKNLDSLATLTRAHEIEARRYKELFERVPVAYLLTDDWGVIQEANRAAADLLNVPSEMLRGKPISVFVPPSERRAFRDRLNTLPLTSVWEVVFQPRAHQQIAVQIDVATIPAGNGTTKLGWVLQNMTPQRAAASTEKMLAREATLRMEAQAAVTRLRALHVGLEMLSHGSTLPRRERIRDLLEELVPRFARSMVCHLPDEPPVEVGEPHSTDQLLQTMIVRTGSAGRLIARRNGSFSSEDSAILLAAANAIGLLYCPAV